MSSDGSQARLRSANRREVIETLRASGAMTRSALVRATGLSRTTVSTLLAELAAVGYVSEDAEGPARAGGPGRPATLLRLTESAGVTVSVDVGARHLAVAIGDLGHAVHAERWVSLPHGHLAEDAMERATALVDELLAEAGCGRQSVIGVAMGLPAPISRPDGLVASSNILPGWAGLEVAGAMGERLELPVFVENDANLGALAESTWGAGAGTEDVVYIKVSTGIGGGIVQEGRLFRGTTGTAGEIGHVTVAEDGPVCRCGNRGCLELYAGGGAMLEALAPSHPDLTDLEDLVALTHAGDPACVRVVSDAGRHIGVALASLINLVNPQLIVIGGTLGRAGEPFLEPMRVAARRLAVRAAVDAVEIVPGVIGDRAEMLGGLALVVREPWRFADRERALTGAA